MPSGNKQRSAYLYRNLLSVFAIVISIIVMMVMKDISVNNIQDVKSIEMAKEIAIEVVTIKQTEAELLNHYKAIDKVNGVYQIPIEHAMELVVQDYKKDSSI